MTGLATGYGYCDLENNDITYQDASRTITFLVVEPKVIAYPSLSCSVNSLNCKIKFSFATDGLENLRYINTFAFLLID